MKRLLTILSHPLAWLAVLAALVIGFLAFEQARVAVKLNQAIEEAKEEEAKRLAAEELLVAETASRKQVENELGSLRGQVDSMATLLGKKPKVVEVVKWRTKEIPIPMPADDRECPDGSPAPPCPPVAVEVAGNEARLETVNGNTVAVGEIDVWRTSPLPREKVATVPWEVDGSKLVKVEKPALSPRWYVGAQVGVLAGEAALGPAVVGPPLRLFRVEARPVGGGLVNPSWDTTLYAGIVFGITRKP